ncbi:SMI1/KNR4 family protein [Rhodococcus tukisamuensis]|uniref:SMI1-KNR4 cell-wall n=1 Tax=Rhodococcus tukisamuensis TaxID=168276 RepID=A0A1G6SWB5_9NOCA|nr:SMI1/KNR4 family protein [Rhodococcus tukisamuensis]SDD21053.1 SMI1-KNR4 cell-wall [Rhodococcus tukisamuensis]
MRPDLEQLRSLLDASPGLTKRPAGPASRDRIENAQTRLGPLPPSYRWWLGEYGAGWLGGAPIATVAPEESDEAITAGWRSAGPRLCFHTEEDGDEHHFALDRRGADGEWPVVRRDRFDGAEYPVAETFAGFLAVRDALARGLRDGPNPTIAALWRSTPGVLRDDGVLLYGPHQIQERNETFEVRRYAPDWMLVGDDSGGRGLFMRHHGRDRRSVRLLDLGAIGGDLAGDGELLTDNLIDWLGTG